MLFIRDVFRSDGLRPLVLLGMAMGTIVYIGVMYAGATVLYMHGLWYVSRESMWIAGDPCVLAISYSGIPIRSPVLYWLLHPASASRLCRDPDMVIFQSLCMQAMVSTLWSMHASFTDWTSAMVLRAAIPVAASGWILGRILPLRGTH